MRNSWVLKPEAHLFTALPAQFTSLPAYVPFLLFANTIAAVMLISFPDQDSRYLLLSLLSVFISILVSGDVRSWIVFDAICVGCGPRDMHAMRPLTYAGTC